MNPDPLTRTAVWTLLVLLTLETVCQAAELRPRKTDRFLREKRYFEAQSLARRQDAAESLVESKNTVLTLAAAAEPPPALEIVPQYDAAGRLSAQRTYEHGQLTELIEYEYHPAEGRLAAETSTRYASGAEYRRLRIEYDARLRRVLEVETAPDGRRRSSTSTTYGADDRVTGKVHTEFGADGTRTTETATTYEQGRPSGSVRTRYDGGAVLGSEAREYDAQGLPGRVLTRDGAGYPVQEVLYGWGEQRSLRSTTTRRYAGEGILWRSDAYFFGADGALERLEVSTADALGRAQRIERYDGQQRLLTTDLLDPSSGLTRQRLYHRSDLRMERAETLDGAGRVVSMTRYAVSGEPIDTTWYDAGIAERRAEYGPGGRTLRVVVLDPSGRTLRTWEAPHLDDPAAIVAGFSQDQAANGTGLVRSHPDDPAFIYHEGIQQEWAKIPASTQAYTYDQALSGMAMLGRGDLAGATRILDHFHAQWQAEAAAFTGFWTVYNVDPAFAWKRYEWRKGLGENAWLALFLLKYADKSTDELQRARATQLAAAVGRWTLSLPHHHGAIAMGPDNPAGAPNFGRIYSVENNLDQYALMKALAQQASLSESDRQTFAAEAERVKQWLRTEAFDAQAQSFRRGGNLSVSGVFQWDPVASMDVNAWAVPAIGADVLEREFGADLERLLEGTAARYAVTAAGAFESKTIGSAGFDFSDQANAAAIGRPGMKWVEGTNQMVLAYKVAAGYYEGRGDARAAYYRTLAEYFSSRNAENALVSGTAQSHPYADRALLQIYAGTGNWKTFPGRAVPSAAWVYLSATGTDPFDPASG